MKRLHRNNIDEFFFAEPPSAQKPIYGILNVTLNPLMH